MIDPYDHKDQLLFNMQYMYRIISLTYA